MPKTANEVFRDFVRYSGDGLPGEPAGYPLPGGDPSSGVHNPTKADIREVIGDAGANRAAAEAAAAAAQGAAYSFATVAGMVASPIDFTPGTVVLVRETGHAYRVMPVDFAAEHYTTASGDKMAALDGIVLVAAGQSNIASSNAHASEGGDLLADPRIKVWNGTSWVTWDPAAGIPAGIGAAGRNVILFQAAKEALRQGVPAVWCINDGHAGDTISEWVGTGTSSPNWVVLKGKLDGAFASPEFAALGIEVVDGMIWGQGESDGSSGFSLTYYTTAFETLKSQLRALSYFPRTTPITVLEMPPQPSASVTNAYILDALPYDSDPHTSVTRTKGLQIGADTLHWTGNAMGLIGARAYRRIAEGTGDSLNSPARVTTPFMKVRFDPVFGKGLGITYSAADDRIVIGSSSDIAGDTIVQPFLGFDFDGALLMLSQHARCYSGLTLLSYTGANFASAAHAVNTNPNKMAGTAYWDSVNSRLMVATGTGATAPWAQFNAATTVTPT